MCELTRHGMAGDRHGKGMGAAQAQHGICDLAFKKSTGAGGMFHVIFTPPKMKNHMCNLKVPASNTKHNA
jgi:hypothetical protein